MGLNLQPDGLTASSAGLAGQCQLEKNIQMGLNLQPDGLTASSAGLAGQCQLEKNIHSLKKKKK